MAALSLLNLAGSASVGPPDFAPVAGDRRLCCGPQRRAEVASRPGRSRQLELGVVLQLLEVVAASDGVEPVADLAPGG